MELAATTTLLLTTGWPFVLLSNSELSCHYKDMDCFTHTRRDALGWIGCNFGI